MKKIYVLQQQSTGDEIYREKVIEEVGLVKWEKAIARKLARLEDKKQFWEALKNKDYIASWYGPNHDKFMETVDRKTYHTVCDFVFKEPRADNLTQDEMIELLHQISKMYEKTPLKVSKNVEKRKYNLDRTVKAV